MSTFVTSALLVALVCSLRPWLYWLAELHVYRRQQRDDSR